RTNSLIMQQMKVGDVFHQRESSSDSEAADGRIGHKCHPRSGDQKDPEDGLGTFLHHRGAKPGVLILSSREDLEEELVDNETKRRRRSAAREGCQDGAQ